MENLILLIVRIFFNILFLLVCQTIYSQAQITISTSSRVNIEEGSTLIAPVNLTINAGAVLDLYGHMTVNGTLTNNAGTSGLVVHSDANNTGSLIESTGVSATVERYITQDIYHYITPPVSGQNISLLQSGTPHTGFDLFWYDEDYAGGLGPAWIDASEQSGNLEVCLGYAYTYNPDNRTIQFEGTTNQGTLSETVSYTYNEAYSTDQWYFGWNLVGNPYPSRINATTFIDDADNSDIYGTLYLWDEAAGYANARNDYGTWNKTGATSGGGGNTPNGYIDVGQAFMIHYGSGTGQTSSVVSFKNNMRVHDGAVFFKYSDPWRFKLCLINQDSAYNEILIGFVEGCSMGFDNKYDGFKLKGNSDIALYTKLVEEDGYDYAIQALPALAKEGVSVKLGFNSSTAGLHTLKVKCLENFNDTVAVYLEDSYQQIYSNLRCVPEYHFTTEEPGVTDDRFVIHFNNYGVGIGDQEAIENEFRVYPYFGNIVIESGHHHNYTALVYDASGCLCASRQIINEQKAEIRLSGSTGIYLVRIIDKKQVCCKKVFIH